MSEEMSAVMPEWYDGKKINEVMFCDAFLEEYPMKCIRGQFFTVDGLVDDENMIRMEIYNRIKSFVTSSVAKKATQLMEALKLACYSEPLPVQLDRIHVANGTYFLDGTFSPKKEFCMNRLKVAYNPDAPVPTKWLSFLHDLLMDMDVLTVQEYTGYCLLPTNRAQKMLIILGKGGEGKSRIGITLRYIYGDNMNTGSIMKLETNQFFRACQEYKLVMVDDDMKMVALPETSYIKSMVTLEDKMDIERKGQQSVQRELYVRFIAFGNGTLQALYDHSYAFYRRQLILTTKDRPADRVDDRFLVEKFKEETEGIFLWMLQGLHRLIANNYNFTESEQAQKNLEEAFADSNNIPAFLESSGYIRFEEGCQATSVHIYTAYLRWCKDNLEKPLSANTFKQYLKQHADKYGIVYSKHILDGKRGYRNILVLINPDRGIEQMKL